MEVFSSSWIPYVLLFIVAYKNLPLVWHYRFVRSLLTRCLISPATKDHLRPECLFLPTINRTRAPLTECDYNIHKSNSTYFTDIDISRGNLSLLLFTQCLSFRPTPEAGNAFLVLSGVQCVFRKEIRPYEPYEVWSRVFSWDEKWLYVVTHFVKRGAFRPREFCLQQKGKNKGVDWAGVQAAVAASSSSPSGAQNEQVLKKVFASAVSRFVFKQGRKTMPPEKMFMQCGLLPAKGEENGVEAAQGRLTWDVIEERRRRNLEAAQLKLGWDAVHATFEGDVPVALGTYTDLLWR
ncbi:hypothetical protein AJ79_02748 [Helicocarpus griseus UAMH5409]|uniref:Thioesterase n=1 Tax=Helicocarpus griseus UAMH5409 TaxID=1447875 RepID=A0A2B7Y095_9EURO|nr:hypothetical protein AJ79_02748 [Helicocarpus griseus UAMH5409]